MSTLDIPIPRVFSPFLEPSRYKAAFGGRGSAKSHTFAGLGVSRCLLKPKTRMVCIREVQRTLRESAKRLIEDKIDEHKLHGPFKVYRDNITTPGGGNIIFQGMQDHNAESIKSLEGYDIAWIEEAHTLSERSLELLRPTIRAKGSEIWASWNPRSTSDPVDAFFRGSHPPDNAVIIKANFYDNPFFPPELEAERQHDFDFNRERYAHIWEGEYEPMAVGAIWDRATINQYRRGEAPALDEIVIGTDPAISNDTSSDEYGIVVSGRGVDQRGYILEDLSSRCTPHQWATRAIAAYDHWEADWIVVETNQGGDHVINTLKAVRPDVNVIEVKVTRRKPDRAKPISALYNLGRVSHVGTFTELEDQMCRMTSIDYEGEGSPDRLDAMVIGMSKLFPQMAMHQSSKPVVPPPPLGEHGWMA